VSGYAKTEDAFITENDILGPRKKAKADYTERMASIQKGREGREKFGSLKGKRSKEVHSSSTNREKARNKPIMMMMGSGAVRGKKKVSLREKNNRGFALISISQRNRGIDFRDHRHFITANKFYSSLNTSFPYSSGYFNSKGKM